jgi:thioredoxin reductase (NADPH)
LKHEYDIVIVGGGPAGISAAIWAWDLDLTCALVERSGSLGGQLSYVFNPIRNYPARWAGNGEEMRTHFLESLKHADFDLFTGREVTQLEASKLSVDLDDGTTVRGRAIIIATGVRRRTLNVPGEDDFQGKGILLSGAMDPEKVKSKNVVIVGGGDAAIENALILSDHANRVTVVHRSETFKAREEFLQPARSKPNIEFLSNKTIEGFHGEEQLENVEVLDRGSGESDSIDTDLALIRIGSKPNSEFLLETIKTDSDGYIVVSSSCQTSAPKIYAVGDVTNPISKNISTASGNASTAVSHISKSRNRSR